ncbi:MAG TPA: hypothetical protein GYA08_02825 [Chloroflexi bacterium]|nr:hypothetical protein [Chloroflexota bacterium]
MLIRTLRRLQPLFILLALLFIALLLRSQWQELQSYAWQISPVWLMLSAGWLVAAWGVEVAIWRRLLRTVGGRLPYRSALRIWFLSAIVRYIPGNIWQPLSITLLAQQRGVKPEATLTSIVLYQAIITLAVAPIAAIYFAGTGNWGVLTDVMREVAPWLIVIGLAPPAVFIAQPAWLIAMVNWGLQRLGRSRLPYGLTRTELLYALALAAIDWLLWGAAFATLAFGIHAYPPADLWTLAWHLIAIYPVAYVIGFLSFITPSGLGVREGALYLLLAPVIGGATITLLALAMRVWTTLGEVIAAGVSALIPDPVVRVAAPSVSDAPAADLRERLT